MLIIYRFLFILTISIYPVLQPKSTSERPIILRTSFKIFCPLLPYIHLRVIPRTVNMTNFISVMHLCYMAQLTLRRFSVWAFPDHRSPFKAHSCLHLIAEKESEIRCMRRIWHTIVDLKMERLCHNKFWWLLGFESSPTWEAARRPETQSYNCKELNFANNKNDLEIGFCFKPAQWELSAAHTLMWASW